MEIIIKKAIEGGWKNENFPNLDPQYMGDMYRIIVCDPLFWQSLGKTCEWTEIYKNCGRKGIDKCCCEYDARTEEWKYYAIRFHEINLTQGFERAVEYLEELVN